MTFGPSGRAGSARKPLLESLNLWLFVADNSRISKGLSGVAGEYFVAGELSRRGYIASITLRNMRGVDILVSGRDAARSAGIQVKTNQGSGKGWVLNKKAETLEEDGLYYVFVNLNGPEGSPTYYVVPSAVVAEYCRRSHREWLPLPGVVDTSERTATCGNFGTLMTNGRTGGTCSALRARYNLRLEVTLRRVPIWYPIW